MTWALFALAASFCFCIQSEVNKHFKIDGFLLTTAQALISFLMLIPFIPLMEWPTAPTYYVVALLSAAISVVVMMAMYNLAANKNGRVACLYQPVSVILMFFLWLFIDVSQRQFLIENPYNTAAIFGGFVIFGVSIQFIRRNDAGWRALLAVIPIAILFSIGTVLSKIFLEQAESPLRISLNFVFLLTLFMFLFTLPILLSRHIKGSAPLVTVPLAKAAFMVGFFHTVSWVLFNVAIILSPNPAYVSVVDGLIPVWFMLYYRLRGFHDDASPRAGVLLGIASIIIIIASV